MKNGASLDEPVVPTVSSCALSQLDRPMAATMAASAHARIPNRNPVRILVRFLFWFLSLTNISAPLDCQMYAATKRALQSGKAPPVGTLGYRIDDGISMQIKTDDLIRASSFRGLDALNPKR